MNGPDPWLQGKIHRPLCPDAICFRAIGPDDRVLAAAAFEQWSTNGVGVHVAADNPLALRHTRPLLDDALRMRRVVWCLVEEQGRSADFARRLGFVETGRIPGAGENGSDIILLVLTRERWAERRDHVRQHTPRA